MTRLEADVGVELVGGNRVVLWRDQIFRYNNHFTGRGAEYGFGAPLLVENELNGYPVIRFDGEDDALAHFGTIAGFPHRKRDRSVYMVASYKGVGGGFVFGEYKANKRFGLTLDGNTGNYKVIGGGNVNDKTSTVNGANAGWAIQGADVIDEVMYHRLNNTVIDTFAHAYDTQFEGQAVIGADIDFTPFVEMDVAAIFVYDDSLTEQERNDLHAYIEDKYEISIAVVPVANDDSYEIQLNTVTTLAVLENDTDDVGLVPSSVAIVTPPTGGTISVNGSSGTITYTHDGVSVSDTFQYTVNDVNGNTSSPATVSIEIDTDLPPIALNDSAGVLFEGTVDIAVLDNDIDDFGIDATSVAVVQQPLSGSTIVDPVSGVITYTHTGQDSSDFFTYVVLDNSGQRSEVARVDINLLSPGVLPTGLVAQYESDVGVVLSGDEVESWADLSGNGNTLFSIGDVQIKEASLGDLPAISFDGSQDRLERISGVAGLPTGDQNRTVYFLAKYRDNGVGGASFGVAENNKNFGLVVNRFGKFGVSGYGVANDFYLTEDGPGAGWRVHSATLDNGELKQYLDGEEMSVDVHTFDTDSARIVLGAEISGNPQLDMDIGALFVFDRALTDTERQQVENYLAIKFAIDSSNNDAPVAFEDRFRVASASVTQIDVLENDVDDVELDPATIQIIAQPLAGTVMVNPVSGVITYAHNGLTESDSFSYQVRDNLDRLSNIANVLITIGESVVLPTIGLSARWESTDLVTQVNGTVSQWGDISGFDNTLDGLGNITLAPGVLNGNPVLELDGDDDAFFRDDNDVLHDFVKFNNDRTMLMLVRYDSLGDGGFGYGDTRRNRQFAIQVGEEGQLRASGRGPGNDFETSYIASNAGWIVQSATLSNGLLTQSVDGEAIAVDSHTFNTDNKRLAIGSDLTLENFVDMDIAAVMVYRRALTDVELDQAVDYLNFKYGYKSIGAPDVRPDFAVSAVAGTTEISVLANDVAIEGVIDAASLEVVEQPNFGSISVNPATGVITYTHDGDDDAPDNFTYRVANSGGRYSVEARVSIEIDTDISPIANDDTGLFTSGETIAIDVLANDEDDFGINAETVVVVTPPAGGSVSVDPVTGFVSYTHDGVVTSDSFQYTVLDNTDQISNIATVDLGIPQGLPNDGLVMYLESDTGVVEENGVVVSWVDQSANGNDLISTGDPQLITSELSQPVVHLDGDGDRLERLANIVGMPDAGSDRTIYMLVRYDSDGFGGFGYGTASNNQAFGLAVNNFGRLAIQGWGAGNDFVTSVQGAGEGWILQSAKVEADVVTHAINNVPISTDTHTFNTAVNRVMLGANISGGPQVDMQVGAVMVYDRALNPVEQAQLYNYVDEKYRLSVWNDPAPIAVGDSITLANGASASIDVLANDSDAAEDGAEGALDPSTLTIVQQPLNGAVFVDNVTGFITYVDDGTEPSDQFTYTINDTLAQVSNEATVAISNIPVAGLVAHYEADALVALSTDGSIVEVLDRSGAGNHLSSVGDVTIATNILNGNPVFDFDGSGDALLRTENLNSLPVQAQSRTMYQVVKYDSTGSGGVGYGLRSGNRAFGLHVAAPDGKLRINGYGPAADKVSDFVGTGAGWIVQSVVYDGATAVHKVNDVEIGRYQHTFATGNGPIVIGADLDQDPYVDMQLGAVLLYNRALTEVEQAEINLYLGSKFDPINGGAPLANADRAIVGLNATADIAVLDNDLAVDGVIENGSVEIVTPAFYGVLDVNSNTGVISYTNNGDTEPEDSFTYRVANTDGRYSQPAEVVVTIDPDLSPVANDDAAVIVAAQTLQIDVLANDEDDIELNASTVVIGTEPEGGSITIDPVTGVVSYLHDGVALEDSFTYFVSDSSGQLSNEATVTLAISSGFPSSGLVLQLESDSGVQSTGSTVTAWLDQSGVGNDLTATGDPQLVQSDLFLPVIHLDGDGDRLERLANINALPEGNSDRSVFLLVRYDGNGFGGFGYGTADNNQVFGLAVNNFGRLAIQGWGAGNDFVTTNQVTGQGWVLQGAVLSSGTLQHFVNGTAIDEQTHTFATDISRVMLGANISGGPQVDMQVGAVMVYDRALSAIEQAQLLRSIDAKYGLSIWEDPAPVALDDSLSFPSGTSANIAVLANDSDEAEGGAVGAIDASTVTIATPPTNGVVAVDPITGVVTYAHNGEQPSDQFTYTVADTLGQVSNEATVTLSNLPVSGLVAHYEADGLVSQDASGVVLALGDKSGQGNDLTAEGDVTIIEDGLNGMPVLDFDGAGDALTRVADISGMPTGANARTIYQVVRYESVGSGGFGYGLPSGNRAFGLHVHAPDGRLRINGYGPANDKVSDTIGTELGWFVQSVVYDGTTAVHAVDGAEIGSYVHSYNTGVGSIVLGADLDNNPHVDMQVAAVLVYNRVLSANEQAELVDYLDSKYNADGEGAPLALADAVEVGVSASVDIDVLDNDVAVSGAIDTGSVELVATPQSGTVSINPASGVITYTHDDVAAVSDVFSYRVANVSGRYSRAAEVSITVDPDLSPVANDDAAVILAGQTIEIDVLLNDVDDLGFDFSSFVLIDPPAGGSVSMSTDTGLVSYVHEGITTEDVFSYTISDTTGQVSNVATVTLSVPDGAPVSGLVMHLESDVGVQASGSLISQWSDQSGNGNDLFSTGDPQLVQSDLYIPVVHLDGDGDRLERLANISALPEGDSDRSVFLLVRYDGNGFGGFGYGTADNNQVFGLAVNNVGRLAIQGWGAGNDFITPNQGTGQGWMLQTAVLSSGTLQHFINGTEVDEQTHTFATNTSRVMLGANIAGGSQVDMQVAAVYVYDRALQPVEQSSISNHLQEKYGFTTWDDPRPVATNDLFTMPGGTSAALDVLANDFDFASNNATGQIDVSTVVIVDQPENGVATVNDNTGEINYSHSGLLPGDSFTYRVSDTEGQPSNVAVVSITNLPTSGLVAHYESVTGVAVDGTGNVTVVSDLSGRGNDLSAVGDVTLVNDALNGQPVLDFDGTGDALLRTAGLADLPIGSSPRTVYQVVRYDSVGSGGFGYGLPSGNRAFGLHVHAPDGKLRINGYGPANDKVSDIIGTDSGWIVQSAIYDGATLTHSVNGAGIGTYNHTYQTGNGPIVLGADLDQNPYVDMQVAAVLLYNRALTAAEQAEVSDYLDSKFDADGVGAPIASVDTFDVDISATIEIAVLSNDVVVEGSIDVTSVQITAQPQYGSVAVGSDGVVSYTHDGSIESSDSFSYRVANDAGRYSQSAIVTATVDTDAGPLAVDDTAVLVPSQTISIAVLDNDTDDFEIDITSVVIESNPSQGTVEVDSVTGEISYTHTGNGLNDSFQYSVSDDQAQASNIATVTLSIPNGLPIGGLVLLLESDTGVQLSNGNISSWVDQSGLGNDLFSTGDPQLLDDGLLTSVVHLDGDGDRLERLTSVVGMPEGSADRSVFMLVKYQSNGFGGFAFGTAANNEAFGIDVNNSGRLAVQGFGAGNDFVATNQQGNGRGWIVQSAVLDQNVLTHAVDGNTIRTDTHTFDTNVSRIELGANVSGGPQVDMNVATVIVFDRALSVVEQAQVQVYIDSKYGVSSIDDPAAVAADDTYTIPRNTTASLDVLSNDSDLDSDGVLSSLDPASVVVVQAPANGSTEVNSTTGEIEYTHVGPTSGDVFTYQVADVNGRYSNEATVTITNFPLGGLVAHYEADSLVTFNGAGDVVSVGDKSGFGNDLTASGDVQVITNGLNGRPVFDFDGIGDSLVRNDDLIGFPLGATSRSVYQVVRYNDVGSGGVGYGRRSLNQTFGLHVKAPEGQLRINGFGGANDYTSNIVGTNAGWIIQSAVYDGSELEHSVNGESIGLYTHTFNTVAGPLVIGADLDLVPYLDMEIAAVLIYDRALGVEEQAELVSYIDSRYAVLNSGGPQAANDSGSVLPGLTTTIDVLANDMGSDFDLSTLQITTPAGSGVASIVDGAIEYVHDGSVFDDSFGYMISDVLGRQSNEATVTITLDNPAPMAFDDGALVDIGSTVVLDILSNDTDDSSLDDTSVQIVDIPVNGIATVLPDGTVEYVHDGGAESSDSFTYTVLDDEAEVSNLATVFVAISGNDPVPVVENDSFKLRSGSTLAFDVLANDSDNTGLVLGSVAIDTPPSNGIASVNTLTGEIDYTHDGLSFGDSFTYTVEDTFGQISAVATVEILNLPVDGLVALYDAREQVAVDGLGAVVSVADQSALGNDLTANGDVTVVENALNGQPVFDFDGDGDVLERLANINDYPVGDSPRSIVQLVRYDGLGNGGFGYGTRARNRAFGLHVRSASGELRINGFGPTADFNSGVGGTGAGWIVQSAVYDGSELNHYLDGLDIGTYTHTFATQIGPIVMGADLDRDPYVDMQVGLVLVYDRALSLAESSEVAEYINQVYGIAPDPGAFIPPDLPPVAVDDLTTVVAGSSITFDVSDNDTDDGSLDLLSVLVVDPPSFGTAVVDTLTGEVTYTHTGNAETEDSFTYTISDDIAQPSNLATLTITIENAPPVAVADVTTVANDGVVVIDVAFNDTDNSGVDATSVVITSGPANGTATVDPVTGAITYAHDGTATTSDTIEYTIEDDEGLITDNTGVVTITIDAPVNTPPVAVADAVTVENDGVVVIDVAFNDTDNSGVDATSVAITSGPANGTATVDPVTGAITYDHDGTATTSDTIEYTIEDDEGLITDNTGVVTITIDAPVNTPPVAVADSTTVENDGVVVIDVAFNDTDNSGVDATSVVITSGPANGTATVDPVTGAITYDHDGTATTSDTIEYTIEDDEGLITDNTGVVTITIDAPVNTPPVAVADSTTVENDGVVVIDVAFNDTDNSGVDATSVAITSGPANGTATVDPVTGAITYDHDGTATTSDTIEYTIEDDEGLITDNTGVVTITIDAPVNTPPVAVADSTTVENDGVVVIDVAFNDTDNSGVDATSVAITSGPANGTATVDPVTGAITYDHDGTATTSDTIEYTIEDDEGLITDNTGVVTITIDAPVNTPPVAVADSTTVENDGVVVIDVAFNDTDNSGVDATSVAITSGPANGTATVDPVTGAITYDHDGTATTSDTIEYTIEDDEGLITDNTGVVTITIDAPVNTPPVAVADSTTVENDGVVVIDVAFNDTDNSGVDATSVVITSGPANGTATVDPVTGAITYDHDGTATTSDTIEYTIEDDEGLITDSAGVVTITIDAPVNTPPVAVADAVTVENDGVVVIDVAFNDTDNSGVDATSVAITSGPANGTATVDPVTGAITYDHDGTATTSDTIEYTIEDDEGLITDNTGVVTITIDAPVNTPPVAVADSTTVENDGVVVIDVAFNDTDNSGVDATSVAITSGPANGTATVDPVTGAITYDHDGTATTSDTIEYTIEDDEWLITDSAGVVAITIDDLPVAVDDDITVAHAEAVVSDVLFNDTDDNGIDVTSVVVTVPPSFGTTTVDPLTGEITYEHDGGINLIDSYSYTVNDDAAQTSNTALVGVEIDPPTLPATGLVMHLESDQGVTPATGSVIRWDDITANLNDLAVPAGSQGPVVEANALNSVQVLNFDGVDDLLEIENAFAAIPVANSDRSIFIVLDTAGGVALQYGSDTDNAGIELGADIATGNAYFDSNGVGNLHISSTGLSGQGWRVQSLVIDGGSWSHYLDDTEIDSGTGSFATGSDTLTLGGSLPGGSTDASIAAVIIYNSALSAAAHYSVVTYLNVKFGLTN